MKSFHIAKFIFTAVLIASSALIPSAARAQSTISSIYTAGAGTYTVTGTVTGILNATSTASTFILADSTGSVITYNIPKATYTAAVGDNVTFTTTNSPYQGSPELTSSGFTAFTLNSTANPTSAPLLTIPQFVAAGNGSTLQTANPPYAEAIVTLNNVFLPTGTTSLGTKTTYALSDASGNTTNMYTYTTDSAVAAAVMNANAAETASGSTLYSGAVNITGYVDVYFGASEIYPTSIVAAVPEPSAFILAGCSSLALMIVARRTRRDPGVA